MTSNVLIAGTGLFDVVISFPNGPPQPTGFVNEQREDNPAISEACYSCPNSLVCFSMKNVATRCKSCGRVSIGDYHTPPGSCVGDNTDQNCTVLPGCTQCAQEYIVKRFSGALAPFVGRPVSAETLRVINDSIENLEERLSQEYDCKVSAKLTTGEL